MPWRLKPDYPARSPLAASIAPSLNLQSLIIGELPAGNMFHAIAAAIGTSNWRGSDPFRIALFAMTPNIMAIGFCDRPLPLLQLF